MIERKGEVISTTCGAAPCDSAPVLYHNAEILVAVQHTLNKKATERNRIHRPFTIIVTMKRDFMGIHAYVLPITTC